MLLVESSVEGSTMFRTLGLPELLVLLIAACVVIPLWKIYSKAGYPGFLALGMFIPVVNIGLLLFLGFSDWPVHKQLRALQHSPPPAPPVA